MNTAFPVLLAIVVFVLAYRYYGRYVAKMIGLDPARETPSVRNSDGVDYVPTQAGVVFSHHFASIAGGGPILGPSLALIYGYNLPLFWLLIGCVLIGAVHDFTSLFVSMREGGRSLAEVARKTLGESGFFLFISFTILSLLTVIVAFLGATVAALTSTYPLQMLGLPIDQTILKTVVIDGVVNGRIGGIASTSVFVVTGFAPFVGYLLYVRKIRTYLAALLAVAVCVLSIVVGVRWPVTINPDYWRAILCVYVLIAAGIPVWIILQPRDFTNSFILYVGIALIAVATVVGGLMHLGGADAAQFVLKAPATNIAEGTRQLGLVWPILFITVACGAVSGFHSLVAGGTSSKQICNEGHAQVIGFGGMLLEGLFAVGVLTVLAAGLEFDTYRSIVFPAAGSVAKSNPILAFALAFGTMVESTIRLPKVYGTVFGILLVEGFVVTTLDTSVRLCRYLLEELWSIAFKTVPGLLRSYLFNAGLVVVVSFLLAMTNSITKIWPVFGSANQLLAALVLIVVAVWLANNKRPTWFATWPAAFMLVTTIASLTYLLVTKYLKSGNVPLVVADGVLLLLAIGFVVMLTRRFLLRGNTQAPAAPAR